MRKVYGLSMNATKLLVALSLFSTVSAQTMIDGHVFDLNGSPVTQALVSVRTAASHKGADIISVFTDNQGYFKFQQRITGVSDQDDAIVIRKLGYETVNITAIENRKKNNNLTAVMRKTTNFANVAPASAWLSGMAPADMENVVNNCIGCHQVPASEARAYAKQISMVDSTNPDLVREQSWSALVKYMNYLSAEEFGRGASSAPPEANRVYAVGDGDDIAKILSAHFTDDMQELDSYDYGAPLMVNAKTTILEYEVPRPNAIREAILGGNPERLWVADVSSSNMIAINMATGEQELHEIPYKNPVGPHSLHRGKNGSIWMAPFFTSVVAHLDPDSRKWETWEMFTPDGRRVGIHDLSFGKDHELLTDNSGLIWFSDIGNNAVGSLDPRTGEIINYVAPEIEGRPGRQAALYGLVMTSDRKHIWYSQFGIGAFGSFNVETQEFDHSVSLPSIHSGPRRLSINDEDIVYVPLYGSGQLIEYDAKTNEQVGIYDLPDRASAPYAVTWDPVRKVVWIPTSNGDVIYRFDTRDKSFSVLPLPRTHAFLRMLDVDPETGVLITSYANIVEHVHGPRMALLIDPGDNTYIKDGDALSRLISRK